MLQHEMQREDDENEVGPLDEQPEVNLRCSSRAKRQMQFIQLHTIYPIYINTVNF